MAFVAGCHSADRPAAKNDAGKPPATSNSALTPAASNETGANVFFSEIDVPLVDITPTTGVRSTYSSGADGNQFTILESLGGGVAALDFDGDGAWDLYFPGGGKIQERHIEGLPGILYQNRGDWQFASVTDRAQAFAASHYTHGALAADYDNDGFTDVLITGYGGLQLLHNDGDGTFSEVAAAAGLQDTLWSSSAAFGDLNGDGALDLYVCHYVDWSFDNHPFCRGPGPSQRDVCPPRRFNPLRDILYFANGDGTFRDGTADAGLRPDGKGLGVVINDLDGDLDLDVYVANDTTDNFLYLNDGTGRFEEAGLLRGVAVDQHGGSNGSMGVDVGDYNLDGLPDLWVANFEQEAFALYQNRGGGLFQHMSETTGVTALGGLFVGFGTVFLDVERDGDEDLIVTNGHVIKYPTSGEVAEQPILLLNQDGRRFRRAAFPPGSFFDRRHHGRGLVAADFDLDGDLDAAISHNDQPAAVLRNEVQNANHWLRVRLIGRESCRDAIGAHLVLVTNRGSQHRWIRGGGSYLSRGPYEAAWGIAAGDEVKELQITWPGGKHEVRAEIRGDQQLVLLEPDHDGSTQPALARATTTTERRMTGEGS